jgi:hypothetical protein
MKASWRWHHTHQEGAVQIRIVRPAGGVPQSEAWAALEVPAAKNARLKNPINKDANE